MEKRLEIQLPTDLKEFLSSTNGFYHDKRIGNNNLFTDALHMVWEQDPYGIELMCWEELSITFIHYFEWPKPFKGRQTGSGLSEGRQLLIEPRSVKEPIMEFNRKYEKADEGTERVLERATTDFFGGLEQLREMEWIVNVSYHWNTGSVSYRYVNASSPIRTKSITGLIALSKYFLRICYYKRRNVYRRSSTMVKRQRESKSSVSTRKE